MSGACSGLLLHTVAAVAFYTPKVSAEITAPHLSGVFVNIDRVADVWTAADWRADLQAMKAVGIEFFIVHHLARATSRAADDNCPLGYSDTYYTTQQPESPEQQPPHGRVSCLQPRNGTGGTALLLVLEAAAELNLGVYLGFAMTGTPLFVDHGRAINITILDAYTQLCLQIGQEAWSSITDTHRATIYGWYTMLEEWNDGMWSSLAPTWSSRFLNPLAYALKTQLRPTARRLTNATVFASPYYIRNQTRRPDAKYGDLSPAKNGRLWERILDQWALELDLIAPQDAMGAQGNSFENVSSYLGEIAAASRRAGRRVWSNTELFEVYPQSCQWPATCHGRHPAPFNRIKQQMANEAPLVDALIAWEWTSCLSALAGRLLYRGQYPNATAELYAEYFDYVRQHTRQEGHGELAPDGASLINGHAR